MSDQPPDRIRYVWQGDIEYVRSDLFDAVCAELEQARKTMADATAALEKWTDRWEWWDNPEDDAMMAEIEAMDKEELIASTTSSANTTLPDYSLEKQLEKDCPHPDTITCCTHCGAVIYDSECAEPSPTPKEMHT